MPKSRGALLATTILKNNTNRHAHTHKQILLQSLPAVSRPQWQGQQGQQGQQQQQQQQQQQPPPNLQTHGAPQVCTPGPMDPPSPDLPSAIIIGDSVSIGYTPHLQTLLSSKVQVQHAPSAGGGGADDTPYGLQCIVHPLESFIRTARYEPAHFDLITFNFGLHDMEYNTTDGEGRESRWEPASWGGDFR